MFHFMKKEGSYSLLELDSLYPFEFEIYYFMVVKDYKEKMKSS